MTDELKAYQEDFLAWLKREYPYEYHALERAWMEAVQALELGYRAGFIAACNWPDPVPQDVDSPAFKAELQAFIEKNTKER